MIVNVVVVMSVDDGRNGGDGDGDGDDSDGEFHI